jgi:hypothetical protein
LLAMVCVKASRIAFRRSSLFGRVTMSPEQRVAHKKVITHD